MTDSTKPITGSPNDMQPDQQTSAPQANAQQPGGQASPYAQPTTQGGTTPGAQSYQQAYYQQQYAPQGSQSSKGLRAPVIVGICIAVAVVVGGACFFGGMAFNQAASTAADNAQTSAPAATNSANNGSSASAGPSSNESSANSAGSSSNASGSTSSSSDPAAQLATLQGSLYTHGTHYTLDEIKSLAGNPSGSVANGAATAGVYQIGPSADIAAGLYYFGGSASAEGAYYVFDPEDDAPGSYELEDSHLYIGNTYGELDAGDVVVYLPGDSSAQLCLASASTATFASPYASGLYRVGTDIPAGAYTIASDTAASSAATAPCGAYVLRELDLDDNEEVATSFAVGDGTSQTVTVSAGQYLLLYGATATAS